MACPYFYPVERIEDQAWIKPPRLPLGDPCRGVCRADPVEAFAPDTDALRTWCNVGYPGGACPRFPTDSEVDAIRFSLERDDGALLQLRYVLERNYGPLRHGIIEVDASTRTIERESNDVIARQAQVFAESYLRRSVRP